MRMRRIDVVEVPAHSQVEFKPGGLHFMVFGLKKDLAAGSKVPVTLTFKNAGPIDIKVKFGSMKKMKMN